VQIHRVQIDEGFLDGFDLTFTSGLNVVIGERGTGKTSLIELIRFCLGVRGYTAESNQRCIDHAISVLGSGQVTVTLLEGESNVIVTVLLTRRVRARRVNSLLLLFSRSRRLRA
jgi:DNA repair ATPase RecN